MGEMNESMVQQPQMMNAGVVDPNVTMGEQPQVSADQNVVATQNVGLMENDPFQERTSEPAPAIEVATGASIEEPQPIVEPQPVQVEEPQVVNPVLQEFTNPGLNNQQKQNPNELDIFGQ